MREQTEVLIVGGGVCGTRLATLLAQRGRAYLLAEARPDLGGRVRTVEVARPRTWVDLGPAWVWPHQHHVLTLARELGISLFEQHTTGRLVFQGPAPDGVREHAMATMGGSLRLRGGLGSLVRALACGLEPSTILLGAKVDRLEHEGTGACATFSDGREVWARQVVLAMPPRIAAATIDFDPALPAALTDELARVPTWMASHAKAVAVYETPFWRARGLNGDGISHVGPLGELHDASPDDASAGVIFGFFGSPPAWRRAHREELEVRVRAQLELLYGPPAGRPESLMILDWADEPLVATPADAVTLRRHPDYGPPKEGTGAWEGRLVLSGTELAPAAGGLVEGALIAALAALRELG